MGTDHLAVPPSPLGHPHAGDPGRPAALACPETRQNAYSGTSRSTAGLDSAPPQACPDAFGPPQAHGRGGKVGKGE